MFGGMVPDSSQGYALEGSMIRHNVFGGMKNGGMVNPSFNIPTSTVSLGNNAAPRYNGGGQVYNYSAGGIVINPAQGQSEKQIAEYVVSIMDAKNGLRTASTGDKGRYLRT